MSPELVREPMPTEGPFTVIPTKGPLLLVFYAERSTPDGTLKGPSWIAGKKDSDFPCQILRDDIFSGYNQKRGPGLIVDWHGHMLPLVGQQDKPYHFLPRRDETDIEAAIRAFREPDTLFWRLVGANERELAESLVEEDFPAIVSEMRALYDQHMQEQGVDVRAEAAA